MKLTANSKWLAFMLIIVLGTNLFTLFIFSPKPSTFYGEPYYEKYAALADNYFDKWGWDTNTSDPINSLDNDYWFFECGHGGSYYFKWNDTYIYTWDIPEQHNKLPLNFVMLISCEALTYNDSHSWIKTLNYRVLIGTYNTTSQSWQYFYFWEYTFFSKLDAGYNFTYSFNAANSRSPQMKGHIRLLGDGSLTVKDLDYPVYDINRDRRVNVLDMVLIGKHWTG